MKAKLIRSLQIAFLMLVSGTLGYSGYSLVRYARTASRFEVKQLSVSGLQHVQEDEVLARAGFEIGTNVFAVDLDELRSRVEQIQWVRHAIVQRVLPDQIFIKVVERQPIGLGRIRGELYQFDTDAMLLEPDPVTNASFPILDGLRPDDAKGNLEKVDIYQSVVEDLGQTELSEVHISDSGEVSVVSSSDPLMVSLGTVDFRNRWIKYLQLKTQIHQQYPSAVRVDLRFRNQVIVRMTNDEAGEQVIWDAQKKSL
jgi:cell division protein FtsQ